MQIINFANIKEVRASHEDEQNPGSFKKVILSRGDFPPHLNPVMINWARIPKGKKFRRHYHTDMTEIFIILKGKALITLGDKKGEITAGIAVVIPDNTDHQMEAEGTSDVEYLVVGLTRGENGKTIVSE